MKSLIKIQWNEGGILGERYPLFTIRGLSATEKAQRRIQAFEEIKGLQEDWINELEETEGTKCYLNALQNCPLLKGVQTNLYKCFLPLG